MQPVVRRLSVAVLSLALGTAWAMAPAPAEGRPASAPRRPARVCSPARSPHRVTCFARIDGSATVPRSVDPFVPSGYGPSQFHSAYALPTTSAMKQTIAIVDAYADPKVFADLKVYDQQFGLPKFPKCGKHHKTSCLSVLNQAGKKSPLPGGDTSWGLEISLDVQVAHAVCQNCKLLLMEANSNEFSDIEAAVNAAVAKGADVISNSYGDYGNDCNEPGYDHPHVAVVASSGDSGFGLSCPAVLGTVISVGGTTLNLSGGAYASESVWSGSGSGCSVANPAPSWQTAATNWAAIGCAAGRGMNDVSADGDPATGAAVYDSYGYGGWLKVGGTSLSAPLIAGAYALAGNASTWAYPGRSVYDTPSALHDVTTGSNGSCSPSLRCQGGTGFDLPSGIGSPNGLGGF